MSSNNIESTSIFQSDSTSESSSDSQINLDETKTFSKNSDKPLLSKAKTTLSNETIPKKYLTNKTIAIGNNVYNLIERLNVTSGEAELYLVQDDNSQEYIFKYYKPNIEPKPEIINFLKKHSPQKVIKLIEYGKTEKGRAYELQEYAKFGTLGDYIKNSKAISDDFIKSIISEISLCIQEIHSNDIIHRDIKPSNILIRSIEPLELVLTDFGISSISDELCHMTSINRTIAYSSPESMAGVISKSTDYWSVGLIALEMLISGHPFRGMDEKMIMFTITTKSVPHVDEVPEEFEDLVKGLLTRDPQKRWNGEEVNNWLAGKKGIPVYFENDHLSDGITSGKHKSPFKFNNKEFFSIEELSKSFLADESSWTAAIEYLKRGYIKKWLENNEEFDTCIKIDNIVKLYGNDDNILLWKIIYNINQNLPFVFYGKKIDLKSLFNITDRCLQKHTTSSENVILNYLIKGSLYKIYAEYSENFSGSEKDLLISLKHIDLKINNVNDNYLKVKIFHEIFKVLLNKDKFLIPEQEKTTPDKIAEFLINCSECLITLEDLEHIRDTYIVPSELFNGIMNKGYSQYLNYIKILDNLLTNNLIVAKKEFNKIKSTFIIPEEVKNSIEGHNLSEYQTSSELIAMLHKNNLFISNEQFNSLVDKYFIPGIIQNKLKNGAFEFKEAAVFIQNALQNIDSLVTRDGNVNFSDYLIPFVIIEKLESPDFNEFKSACDFLNILKKNNSLVTVLDYKKIEDEYIVPQELGGIFKIDSILIFEQAIKELFRMLENKLIFLKKEYEDLCNNYHIPDKLINGVLMNWESQNCLKQIHNNNLLMKKSEFERLKYYYVSPKIIDSLNSDNYDQYEKAFILLNNLINNKSLLLQKDVDQYFKGCPNYIIYLEKEYQTTVKCILNKVNFSYYSEIIKDPDLISHFNKDPEKLIGIIRSAKFKKAFKNFAVVFLVIGIVAISFYFKTGYVHYYYNAGVNYFKKSEYNNAIESFKKVIEMDPENFQAYKMRANAYYKLRQYEKSVSDLGRAIQIKGEFELYCLRGDVNKVMLKFHEAIKDYSEAIKLDQNNSKVFEKRASLFFEINEFHGAKNDFKRAIELNPTFARAYNGRGIVSLKTGNYLLAVSDFDYALSLNSTEAPYYFNRGAAYYELKKHKKALSDFGKAISIEAGNAEYYYSRGLVYYEKEDFEAALKDFNAAVDLDPLNERFSKIQNETLRLKVSKNNSVVFLNSAEVYLRNNNFEKAIESYDNAIIVYPNSCFAYKLRGDAYTKFQNYSKAVADYSEAISIKPDFIDALFNRAAVLDQIDLFDKAIKDYDKIIELTPDDYEVFILRGKLYRKLNQNQKATEDFSVALKLTPEDPEIIKLISEIPAVETPVSTIETIVSGIPVNVDSKKDELPAIEELLNYHNIWYNNSLFKIEMNLLTYNTTHFIVYSKDFNNFRLDTQINGQKVYIVHTNDQEWIYNENLNLIIHKPYQNGFSIQKLNEELNDKNTVVIKTEEGNFNVFTVVKKDQTKKVLYVNKNKILVREKEYDLKGNLLSKINYTDWQFNLFHDERIFNKPANAVERYE